MYKGGELMALFEFNEKDKDILSIIQDKYRRVTVSQMALRKAINMIANAIAKGEIKVYRLVNGKRVEVIDDMYWTLNIMPNPNETGTDFWKKAIFKLITSGECLIVRNNVGMFVADSFSESQDVLKGKVYSNVQVSNSGNTVELRQKFKADSVLDLKMTDGNITKLIDDLNKDIDDLVTASVGAYTRSHTSKYMLSTPNNVSMKDKDGKVVTANAYADKIKSSLSSADIEVLLSGAGIDLKELENKTTGSSDDIEKLFNQIFVSTAIAFDIPVSSFMGTISEKGDASNEFITYGVSWLVELLNDSLNAKFVGKEDYLKGERVLVDLTNFKHIDVIDSANNLDKLFADGWSHNDIRKLIGIMPIDEDWANEHYTTKNYSNDTAKGGEGE